MSKSRQPVRYQRKRTPGWKKPEGVENIARPSMFGNPFYVKKTFGTKPWTVFFKESRRENPILVESYGTWLEATQAAVDLFDKWFDDTISERGSELQKFRNKYGWLGFSRCIAAKVLLYGKSVMCWCDLKDPCHGDVILRKCN